LETLDLCGTKVTDAGVLALALPNLQRLYLAYNPLENVELADLPALEHLDLSDSTMRMLRAEKAPNLRSLNLHRTFASKETLEAVARLTSLRRLGIASTPSGGEEGLAHQLE